MTLPTPASLTDPLMCRQCRGLCCQGHPGVWVEPRRFLQAFALPRPVSAESLRAMLPGELVLREIDGVAIPAPVRLETGCIFLGNAGCRLSESRRPGQCLALVPAIDTLLDGEIRCQLLAHGSTLTAITNWQRFWEQG